jgi:hypothetical protein
MLTNYYWDKSEVNVNKVNGVAIKIEKVLQIVNSCRDYNDWEKAYNIVFDMKIREDLKAIGFDFDNYDPDMDYEDDVLAYAKALESIKEIIQTEYPALLNTKEFLLSLLDKLKPCEACFDSKNETFACDQLIAFVSDIDLAIS